MIGRFDFSLTPPLLSALVAGAAVPIFLVVIARVPWLSGRNALQFLIGCLAMIALWISLLAVWPGPPPLDAAEICVGLMILGAAALIHLEVWSLLSRGYTLGLLLTLYRAGGALDEDELARRYRGGEGLSWIMKHRVSGLVRAGLVRQRGAVMTLTPGLGVPLAWLYRMSLGILGVRRTG